MNGNNVLGIVFANTHDGLLPELTEQRAMGALPFGGRYRLIDFTLSNLVNAGVSKVGVITKNHYQSLMDHLGSGKPWDLARKNGGLYTLPPYSGENGGVYTGHIDALGGIMRFLEQADEEYVLLCDPDVVCNLDLQAMFDRHLERDADITIACRNGLPPKGEGDVMALALAADGRITDIRLSPETDLPCDYSLDIVLIRRKTLISLVRTALSYSYTSIVRDLYQRQVHTLKFYAHPVSGYAAVIDGMPSYIKANLDLLDSAVRADLFCADRPVYTKVRDEMPVKYGLEAEVSDAFIADGCVIEGRVEHSILARGVKIGRDAVVRNCVLMQGTMVGAGAQLDSVCTDRNADIGAARRLSGTDVYHVFIRRDSKV